MKPPLELLQTPPGFDWTPRLVERYANRLQRGVQESLAWPAAWITVNYAAAARVRGELAGGPAVLAHGVRTFDGFAESVLKQSLRPVRPMTRLQRRHLLRRLIDEHARSGQLDYYQPVAGKAGFLDQVDALITDLKRSYIWPENFAQSARDARTKELAQVYHAYQDHLHQANLYDAQGLFWAASDVLAAHAEIANPIGLLVVDGFTDFTVAQQRVLAQLSTRCQEIAVTLPLETPGDTAGIGVSGRPELFAKSHDTLAALEKNFEVRRVVPGDSEALTTCGPLSHIGRELFRGNPRVADDFPLSPRELHLIEAAGEDSEVRQVAREVKRLLQSGVAAEDVVVARRGLAASADRFRAAFAGYLIPCRIEAASPVTAAPQVRSLLNLLRLHVEDWPYRVLLRTINDRLLGNLTSEARIAAEHCIRKAQFPDGRERLLAWVGRWSASAGDRPAEEDAAGAAVALAKLDAALQLLPESAARADWVDPLEAAASALGLPLCDDPAWRTVKRGLQALTRVEQWTQLEVGPADAADVLGILSIIAREESLPADATPGGAVRIVEADTVRGMRPGHLLLTGLGESSFPAMRRMHPTGELPDSSATTPDSSQSTIDAHASEEMLLFYQLVTRPTEGLTLSYAALDARAQQLEPSPYLAELIRLFPGDKLPVTRIGLTDRVAGSEVMSLAEQRVAAMTAALDGHFGPLAHLAAAEATAPAAQGALAAMEAIAARSGRDAFSPWEGMFTSPPAARSMAKRFGPEHPWSPTQLESYAACPYRFLSEHALGLAPLDDLALRSDPRRRGSLMHRALARAHRELVEADSQQLREEIVDRFLTALNDIVAAQPQQGLEAALREIQRRELTVWAEKLAQQTASYQEKFADLDVPLRPAYYEVRFGPRKSGAATDDEDEDATLSTTEPFVLRLGDDEVRITGQVDRIDVGEHAGRVVFNVIDYKSREKERFDAEAASAGKQLQLPLYAMAIEELLLAGKDALALEAGYWSVAGEGFVWTRRGKVQDQLQIRSADHDIAKTTEAWNQLREAIELRIKKLITGVRSAAFPVYNENEDCTRYCDFSTICRIAHVRSLEKTWDGEVGGGERGEGRGERGEGRLGRWV